MDISQHLYLITSGNLVYVLVLENTCMLSVNCISMAIHEHTYWSSWGELHTFYHFRSKTSRTVGVTAVAIMTENMLKIICELTKW